MPHSTTAMIFPTFAGVLVGICVTTTCCAQTNIVPTTGPAEPAVTARADEQRRAPATGAANPEPREGLSALHEAARRGDAEEVRRLLARGDDAGARGPRGETPLLMAMHGALLDAMQRSMPPPDQADEWSPAKARARERQTRGQPDPQRGPMQFAEVTRLLFAHGADPSAASADGFAPLHGAAQTGNVELVALLISAKANVNALHRPRGQVAQTPLVAGAASGDVNVVRALLDAGADPAKVPEATQGYFVKLAMSEIDVFRLLLDHGLKLPPNALKMATRNGRADAAAEIIRRGKGRDPDDALYAAVTGSQDAMSAAEEDQLVRTVQTLLDAGASPSAPSGSGEALVAAIARGRSRVAQLLRDRGAKINCSALKDNDHHPMKIAYNAAFENRLDRLREFEALGMPLDSLGASILGRADRLGEVIVAGKESVAGEAGSTALYFAAHFGHADCVRVLLDAGTDVNARLPSWDTPDIGPRPLAGAAAGGHTDVVRLLLDRGAKPALLELSDDEWAQLNPDIRKLLRPNEHR